MPRYPEPRTPGAARGKHSDTQRLLDVVVTHSFTVRLCYIPTDSVISLHSWGFGHCHDKKQTYHSKSQPENEGSRVQSDFRV